jgi:hypothetical protein
VFVNSDTRVYLEAFFIFDGDDIAKVNVLTVACTLVTLATAYVLAPIVGRMKRSSASISRRERRASSGDMVLIGLAFYGAGAALKYFFVLPYSLNLTEGTLPGAVATLSSLVLVGIFFLSAWCFEYAPRWLPLAIAPVALEVAISILTFEKSGVLFALIMFSLGALRKGVTRLRLAATAGVVIAAYVLATPIVSFGREELSRTRGSIAAPAGLSERLAILASFFRGGAKAGDDDRIDWALVRISYVNAAAFAVRLHDTGVPSHSLTTLPAVIVPRFLWPNKPIITQVAVDFNVSATGNEHSASSPGLFAEAYWNFGWAGVPVLMPPLGIVLTVMSAFALRVFRERSWLFFPVVALGLKMGLRVDGFFVADVAGAAVLAAALYVGLVLVLRFSDSVLRRSRYV